jgi:hypothetical protein
MALADFNGILSTTLKNYEPTMVDNIFKSHVLLNHLNERGRVQVEEGGTSIVEPLMYAANSTVKTYDNFEAITLDYVGGMSAAEYAWKQIGASISIAGMEEAQNRGTEAIIKLLQARIYQAEESLKETLNDQLFGTPATSKDFNGLTNIVATANNTVGGIDASTNTWWNPVVDSTGATLSLQSMTGVYNDASKGNDVPDLVITGSDLFAKYESLLTQYVRYQDVEKANSGFTNLMFKQSPVVFDKEIDGATNAPMYFLNTKYLKLVGMSGNWFNSTPFVNGTPNGVDARYALIIARGNLVCSNRARQGYLSADA